MGNGAARWPLLFLSVVLGGACPGYTVCPAVNAGHVLATDSGALALLASIDAAELAAQQAATQPDLSFAQLFGLLGKMIVFDKNLSVHRNEACALCHAPAAGFSGGIGRFNAGVATYPGSLPGRTGPRRPQSLAYAAAAPVFAWRPATGDFAGGVFWDAAATGAITGSPAADQALIPFTSPFEMALPDAACAIRLVSQSAYAGLFAKFWGAASLAFAWPANADAVCAQPAKGDSPRAVLALPPADRARVAGSYKSIALTVLGYEASAEIMPFSSKFDLFLAGQARLTAQESVGYQLFTGRAKCSLCHDASGASPLFTDFTAANIGVPVNPKLPFLTENAPDAHGYVANIVGPAYKDAGLGAVLAGSANPAWQAQAARYMGAFQVPTLRNVANTALGGVARAYMHNGYFKNLKDVVHFLNTRDSLPSCATAGATGCWPAPEWGGRVDMVRTGAIGLTNAEEGALVAFMETLTDGYVLAR